MILVYRRVALFLVVAALVSAVCAGTVNANSTVTKTSIYQDGVLIGAEKPDYTRDVKVVSVSGETLSLVNYPDGYRLELPASFSLDFRLSPAFVRASTTGMDIKISREYSPYEDVPGYLKDYPNRFIAGNEYNHYRDSNGIHIIDDGWLTINGRSVRVISFLRRPYQGSEETQNQYLLAYILTRRQEFYTLYFRAESIAEQNDTIYAILRSFNQIPHKGTPFFDLALGPIPRGWNTETTNLYKELVSGERFRWGIFHPWALTDRDEYTRIEDIQKKLSYDFPILLHYVYIGHDFPTEGMLRAWESGHTVELTMQVAWANNDNAGLRNASFDVLDGAIDDTIRAFARDAKAFGHPFFFRLNNEMNTDWSQYSGVLTLNDPDIYIKVWRRIFNIFEDEGVDNAIWVFNPNHHSYPPMNWNHQISYYPGNEYVHVIGLTGYNTGEYFRDVTGERWKTFAQIYDPMVAEYRELYSGFPWIITEFASSSIGGDKAKWIADMFETLPRYPEIRAAVWWSYADYDYRPGKKAIAARRYWLDEKDEYLIAFRNGLRAQRLVE